MPGDVLRTRDIACEHRQHEHGRSLQRHSRFTAGTPYALCSYLQSYSSGNSIRLPSPLPVPPSHHLPLRPLAKQRKAVDEKRPSQPPRQLHEKALCPELQAQSEQSIKSRA